MTGRARPSIHTGVAGAVRIAASVGLVGLFALVGCGGGDGASGTGDGTIEMQVENDPTVTFKAWFAVGSRHDPVGKEGLAALTGAMVGDAATTENSLDAILERLWPLASAYDVSVDKEMSVLTGRTHRDNVDVFLGLLTDAMARPKFDAVDFERHRKDAINTIETTLRYTSDEELGKAALYAAAFDGTRYAHPSVGTVSGLRAITLDDVKAFYERHYHRDNVVLAIGGGYDEDMLERFRASRAGLPDAPVEATSVEPLAVAEPEGLGVLLVDKPDADASISFGFPVDVRRGDRAFYALWIATSWLGEHRNAASHLYQVIREKRGLNYGDYAYIEAFPNGGRRQMPPTHVGRERQLFEVWVRTLPNDNALFALRAAVRELSELVEGGMSEAEFETTRAFLTKYSLHYATTTSERLGYAVDDRFYGIDGNHLERFRTMMSDITREEVNAALREHFDPESMWIAIVTGQAGVLRDRLLSGESTGVVYPVPQSDPALLEEDEVIAAWPLEMSSEAIRTVPVGSMFD